MHNMEGEFSQHQSCGYEICEKIRWTKADPNPHPGLRAHLEARPIAELGQIDIRRSEMHNMEGEFSQHQS